MLIFKRKIGNIWIRKRGVGSLKYFKSREFFSTYKSVLDEIGDEIVKGIKRKSPQSH